MSSPFRICLTTERKERRKKKLKQRVINHEHQSRTLSLHACLEKITKNSGLELKYKREDNLVFHFVDCECCRKQTLKTAPRLQIQALRTTFSISHFLGSRLFLSLLFVQATPICRMFPFISNTHSESSQLCLKEHFSLNWGKSAIQTKQLFKCGQSSLSLYYCGHRTDST